MRVTFLNVKPLYLPESQLERFFCALIRTMFTWLVQSERFCDGFIADEIENGHLLALFRRLRELTGDDE